MNSYTTYENQNVVSLVKIPQTTKMVVSTNFDIAVISTTTYNEDIKLPRRGSDSVPYTRVRGMFGIYFYICKPTNGCWLFNRLTGASVMSDNGNTDVFKMVNTTANGATVHVSDNTDRTNNVKIGTLCTTNPTKGTECTDGYQGTSYISCYRYNYLQNSSCFPCDNSCDGCTGAG